MHFNEATRLSLRFDPQSIVAQEFKDFFGEGVRVIGDRQMFVILPSHAFRPN